MLYSIIKYNRSLAYLKVHVPYKKLLGDWVNAACLVMMLVFWLGYMGNLLVYLLRRELFLGDLLMALFFFFGAFFVFAVITVAHRMFVVSVERSDLARAEKSRTKNRMISYSFRR